jgi:hypothetical protein
MTEEKTACSIFCTGRLHLLSISAPYLYSGIVPAYLKDICNFLYAEREPWWYMWLDNDFFIVITCPIIYLWLCSSFVGPWLLYTVGRTPWTGDRPKGRYLHTEQTHRDIRAWSWIRTHDPSNRASEGSSCLRQRSHSDRIRRYII